MHVRVVFILNFSLLNVLNTLCQNKRLQCAHLYLVKYCHDMIVTTWTAEKMVLVDTIKESTIKQDTP